MALTASGSGRRGWGRYNQFYGQDFLGRSINFFLPILELFSEEEGALCWVPTASRAGYTERGVLV